jgi:hypothetical protein
MVIGLGLVLAGTLATNAAAAPAAQTTPPPTFTPAAGQTTPVPGQATPAAGQTLPTPTPFRFLTATPFVPAPSTGATTTAPRAGGLPVELAMPLLVSGASALGGGLYLLRRRRRH